MAVPLLNLFILSDLSQRVDGVAFRAGLPPTKTFAWGLGAAAIMFLAKLPDPYWILALFSFVPLAVVHRNVMRAQITIAGDKALPEPFSWIEWLIVAVGAACLMLAFFGTAIGTNGASHFSSVATLMLGLIAGLIVVQRTSSAVPEAAHSTP